MTFSSLVYEFVSCALAHPLVAAWNVEVKQLCPTQNVTVLLKGPKHVGPKIYIFTCPNP